MDCFKLNNRQFALTAQWLEIPLAPGNEGSERYSYDLRAVKQVNPHGQEFVVLRALAEIINPGCPIHQMSTEQVRETVHIKIRFTLEQALRYQAITREYSGGALMRFQPFNEARRTGGA